MKTEDVYGLGPDCVTEEMIEVARDFIGPGYGKQHEQLTKRVLELCQQYYRQGAFNMEHKDGATCQAEDQGGWPACANPAEFFVRKEHLGAHEKAPIYCRDHQDNRFFSPHHMAPIYENPNVDPEKT